MSSSVQTVEWILRVAEYIHHHVAFTAIETIGRTMLSLPHRTHGSFQALPVGQVCQLLELINAHDDMDAFCLGNLFWKIENFLGTFLQGLEVQIYFYGIHRVAVDGKAWRYGLDELYDVGPSLSIVEETPWSTALANLL